MQQVFLALRKIYQKTRRGYNPKFEDRYMLMQRGVESVDD